MTDLGRWEPLEVATVGELMTDAPVRWWLSGGCALELFLGHRIREHGDVDISVARADWAAFRSHTAAHLEHWAAVDGTLRALTGDTPEDRVHNVWTRVHGSDSWQLQVNLEPVIGDLWRYRRDVRVRRPVAEVILRTAEVPFVNPAVQMLWKAKAPQPKDEIDYAAVVDELDVAEQVWLAQSVAVAHPDSPWTTRFERR